MRITKALMCSMNNQAVLKALFKIHADELSCNMAIKVAIETEDVAKIAQETVYDFVSE